MNDQQANFFPGPDLFTRMWSDFAGRMLQAGSGFSPDRPLPEASREVRAAMFDAWNQVFDRYLRSEEFLGMMEQSMATSVQARKQLTDFLGQLQHEFQAASRHDVDQIMLSLRHMERRMVDAMERLSEQLDRLGQRLDQLETQAHAAQQSADQPAGEAQQ